MQIHIVLKKGTNENNNRLIRRFIPKGTDLSEIVPQFIKWIDDWINNYPNAIFDYQSKNMLKLKLTF